MRRVGDVLVAVFCLVFFTLSCAAKTTGVSDNTSTPVPIAVFLSDSCGECREVAVYLDQLTASGTPLEVHRYSFEDLTNAPLRYSLDLLYNVPKEDWYVVPTVFIGRTVLIRADEIVSRLPPLLAAVTAQDNAFLLEHLTIATTAPETSSPASTLFIGTTLEASLIDGINPCASAILFLTRWWRGR